MKFKPLMRGASAVTVLFGAYLLYYGTYCLWQYRDFVIPEAIEKDSHGMSRLVGFSFISLLGAVILGVGILIWLLKDVTDVRSRNAITIGFFFVNILAFVLSLFMQIVYWQTEWGKFYLGMFLLLAITFGYGRVISAS